MTRRRLPAFVGTVALTAALVAVPTLGTAPAFAADFPVTSPDDDGPDTLRQAIADANTSSGDDVIVIDPSVGTIVLSSTLTITDPVEIRGNSTTLTRDRSFDMIVVDLAAEGAVEFSALNLDADSTTAGRGIWATSATPDHVTIADSTFSGMHSRGVAGAAVRVDEGSLSVTDSTFTAGWSDYGGTAVSIGTVTSDSTIGQSTFRDNYTVSEDGLGGGAIGIEAIAADAAVHVYQDYFVSNGSGAGRGIGLRGAALHVGDVHGSFVVDSSTFDHQWIRWPDSRPGRTSGWSVGVETVVTGGSVLIVNSTFDEPDIKPDFYVVSIGTVQTGSTFALNHSTVVGGGTLIVDNNQGSSLVRSTIAEGLSAPNAIVTQAGAPTRLEYTVVSTAFNAAYVVDGSGNQYDVADMMLAPLGDNGGPTPTMMIGPFGPAVGTGMPVALPSEPRLEQRGSGFLRRLGLPDIGAVELPGDLPTLPEPTPSPTPTPSFDPPTLPLTDPPSPAGLALTGSTGIPPWLAFTVAGLLIGGCGLVLADQSRRSARAANESTGKRQLKSSHR